MIELLTVTQGIAISFRYFMFQNQHVLEYVADLNKMITNDRPLSILKIIEVLIKMVSLNLVKNVPLAETKTLWANIESHQRTFVCQFRIKFPPNSPPFPRIPFPNLPQLTTVSFSSAVTIVTNLITGAILNSMASVCQVCVCPAREFPLPLTGLLSASSVTTCRGNQPNFSTSLHDFTPRVAANTHTTEALFVPVISTLGHLGFSTRKPRGVDSICDLIRVCKRCVLSNGVTFNYTGSTV